jgi:hypothetical protein
MTCLQAFCNSNDIKPTNIGYLDFGSNSYSDFNSYAKNEAYSISNNLRSSYLEIIKSELKSKYPNSQI